MKGLAGLPSATAGTQIGLEWVLDRLEGLLMGLSDRQEVNREEEKGWSGGGSLQKLSPFIGPCVRHGRSFSGS